MLKKFYKKGLQKGKIVYNSRGEKEQRGVNLMRKSDFYKRITSVKTATLESFGIIKSIDSKLLSTVVAVILLLGSFGIITKYYTLGYDVYYGDVNVGVTANKLDAIETYNTAQNDVEKINGNSFRYDLKFVMTITPNDGVDMTQIYRGIVAAAEGEVLCYSIETEKGSAAKLATYEEAEEALRLLRESFHRSDAEIYTGYSIIPSNDIITSVLTVEEAVNEMRENGKIKVVYKDETKMDVAIPFEEIVVEDDTLALGLTMVVQEGSMGEGVETSLVFYENGEKKHDVSPNTVVTKEPVTRIVHKGTGKMVGLTKNSLAYPTNGTFSSDFGKRWGRNHNGIDLAAKAGTAINAPCYGKVTFAGERSGYGNYVVIDHGEGYVTTYAHMNSVSVKEGQIVSVGDKIGTVGTTGRTTGAHLHFEVLYNGSFVNPTDYIAG